MEKEYAVLWEDNITIDSDSELIDEQKFVGKRKYLDQLIYQINHSYANNCYDAVAVLMRRLFEVLLVLSYQNYGIDDQIKDSTGKGYIMLDGIVTLSLQGRRSEGIKSASCCVAFAPCTPGTCRSSALHDADFMPSDSGDLKRREFLHFQGRRRKRTGSTLIEDNAENEEIIPC